MTGRLVFLKLGGSLITVKDQPYTPRLNVLARLVQEIAEALAEDHELHLLLGHGSGSYGHTAASQFHTRLGVKSTGEWQGFIEVWRQAAALNHLVMEALNQAHLPAIAFPPSAMVISRGGQVEQWNLEPLHAALDNGLLPVVNGDVTFDTQLGGTILSTEDLFSHLARQLKPSQVLFAGLEPGVWADFPHCQHLLNEITPDNLAQASAGLKGSTAIDVTGGMLDKVRQVINLVGELPGLQGMIFSGEVSGNVRRALLGEQLGTVIHSPPPLTPPP